VSSLIFASISFHVFISSTIRMNLHYYMQNCNHSFVLLSLFLVYLLILKSIFIIGLQCETSFLDWLEF
jgi:hypothetical protein